MKGFAIVSKGLEEVASDEIKEHINAETETREAGVIFSINDHFELCKLAYLSQSIDRVLFLLGSFEFEDNLFEKMKEIAAKIDFSGWIEAEDSFRVRCQKIGTDDFSTQHIEETTGEIILEKIGRHKVSLNNPDITFFTYIFNGSCYLGIDFSGFDMHKREYNIFLNPRAIRSTIAYSLVRIAGYSPNELLLDPFSGSGTISIEAALFASGFSVNFYNKDKFAFIKLKKLAGTDFNALFKEIDEKVKKEPLNIYSYDSLMKNLLSAKKNAKIAGIEKSINFSRVDIEWLDTKFKEKTVDKVITHLPMITKTDKNGIKIYHDFFYQIEYILKTEGKIIAISNSEETLKQEAEKYSFAITQKKEAWSGKQKLDIYTLEKKKVQ